MRVLLADNALLQAALAEVRSQLTHERPSSAGAAGVLPESVILSLKMPKPVEVHRLIRQVIEMIRYNKEASAG